MGEAGNNAKKRKLGLQTGENCLSTSYNYDETFSVLWTVKNYSKIHKEESWVPSPLFHGGKAKNHKWWLSIRPKNWVNGLFWGEGSNQLSVSICCGGFTDTALAGTKIKARCEISLLNAAGTAEVTRGNINPDQTPFLITSGVQEWHSFNDFVASKAVVAKDSPLLVDDCLKLHCKIMIEGDLKQESESRTKAEGQRTKRRRERFSNALEKMLDDSSFTDFTIKTKTGSLQAHKVILAARSPVFKSMLEAKMAEAEKNTVTILDFDHEVLEALLKYLYVLERNQFQIPVTMASDLLRLADKYMIDDLMEECEYLLADNLTVENAALVLSLAHLCNADILKPRVVKYITENKTAVTATTGFAQVSKDHPAVFVDLFMASI